MKMKIGCIMLILMLIIPAVLVITSIPVTAQDSNDDMPDWAQSVVVSEHYLLINQKSTNEIYVEELMFYNNQGTQNFSGRLLMWTQPSTILTKINLFGIVSDGGYTPSKAHPSDYSPNFIYINLSAENITIGPSETLQIVYNYTLKYDSLEDASYHKTFLYETTNVIMFIDLSGNLEAEGKENFELIFDSSSGKYITSLHGGSLSKNIGEGIDISFSKAQTIPDPNGGSSSSSSDDNYENLVLYLIIIILAGALVITIIMKQSTKKSKKKTKKQQPKKRKSKKAVD